MSHSLLMNTFKPVILVSCLLAAVPALSDIVKAENSCPPPLTAEFARLSDATLRSRFTELRYGQNKDLCAASEVAYELMHRTQSTALAPSAEEPVGLTWAMAMLEGLLEVQDYRSTIIRGLKALAEIKALQQRDAQMEVRWRMLQALDGAIRALGPEMDATWLEMSLALKVPTGPAGRQLQFKTFLEDYPDSAYVPNVRLMQENAEKTYIARELRIAKLYTDITQYVAAVARLEALIELDFAEPWLPQILFEIVRNEWLAAKAIAHPPLIRVFYKWNDAYIANVFHLKPGEAVDRNAIARLLTDQAEARVKQLGEFYPNSIYTQQAQALLTHPIK